MKTPLPKSITDRYKVEERSGDYKLTCKKCSAAWALKKAKEVSGGNMLALLNHSMGHDVQREPDDE